MHNPVIKITPEDVRSNIVGYTVAAKCLASCEHRVNNKWVTVLCMHNCTFQKTAALVFSPHFGYM
jgi:hypothetical protein